MLVGKKTSPFVLAVSHDKPLKISRPTETYRYPGDKVSEASVPSQLLPVTGHGYRISLRIRTNHVAKVL